MSNMANTVETKLQIKSWDERPYREFDDGRKFSKADVVLEGDDRGLSSGSSEALMYYRADGTSTYVWLMSLAGTLEGRSGSFVLQGEGTYDGKTARLQMRVVADSGTGQLAGLRGVGESVSTHQDYPYMPLTLTYELPDARSQ